MNKETLNNLLINASKDGLTQTVEFLLNSGANIHTYNDEALRWASYNGHTETVKLLLDRGANVHTYNDCPLCRASYNGQIETVKLLLDHGADIHACNDSAIRWASLNGHTETVKVLKEHMNKKVETVKIGENIYNKQEFEELLKNIKPLDSLR